MQRLWAGKDLNASSEELRSRRRSCLCFWVAIPFADYEIGRVLKVINEKIPDALGIYTSDQGAMLGSHHLNQKNAAIYREVANIPLLIRGGEKGKVVQYPASSYRSGSDHYMDYFGKLPKTFAGRA